MAVYCMNKTRKKGLAERQSLLSEPRYQVGVLEEDWQFRAVEQTNPCLPRFKGCSIYSTSYKEPPRDAYQRDTVVWKNKEKAEGVSRDVLLESGDKECRDNFTTTTDLSYRIMPQLCPKLRVYNSSTMEWLPTQSFLPCFGNLTQFGMKEAKRMEWAAYDNDKPQDFTTTMREHYHKPCAAHLVTKRFATSRILSSVLDYNNKMMAHAKFRGVTPLQVPSIEKGAYPIPEWRSPQPILPSLPKEPPVRRSDLPPPEPIAPRDRRVSAMDRFTKALSSRRSVQPVVPRLCDFPCA